MSQSGRKYLQNKIIFANIYLIKDSQIQIFKKTIKNGEIFDQILHREKLYRWQMTTKKMLNMFSHQENGSKTTVKYLYIDTIGKNKYRPSTVGKM